MVTFILHHFMVDYKRVLCMAVDHGHLLLLKRPWIIWPESNALEGVLSESICPKSKQKMSVPSYSLKILHVCAGRQPPHTAVWVCVCVQLEKEFVFLSERHRTALTPRCLIWVCAFVCFVKIQASISTGRCDSLFLWVDEWVYVHVPQNLTLLCGFRIHTNNQNRTLLGPLNHSLC